jgi:uncharacterized membrane protein
MLIGLMFGSIQPIQKLMSPNYYPLHFLSTGFGGAKGLIGLTAYYSYKIVKKQK